jgi:hypothetical protein
MPSVPLISARPSFSAQHDRARARAASASARRPSVARRVADLALADQRERAVGERREVARAAELPYSCTTGVMPALSIAA